MATSNLIRGWIKYLKDNRFAKKESNPTTGEIIYQMQPKLEDLVDYLDERGKFNDDTIMSAVRRVMDNKPKQTAPSSNTPATNTPATNTATSPATPDPATIRANRQKAATQVARDQMAANPAPKPAQPTPQPSDPATIRANKQAAATQTARSNMVPAPQQPKPQTQTQKPLDPATIRANKQAAATQTARDQMAANLAPPPPQPAAAPTQSNKPASATRPSGSTPKVASLLRPKPTIKESLVDELRVPIDEDDVEKIFKLLGDATPAGEVNDKPNKEDDLEKIEDLIQHSMPPEHRKMLWTILKNTKSVAEAYIKDRYMTDIFAGLSKATTNVKMSPEDLTKYWKKIGSPGESIDVKKFLLKLGYSKQDIDYTLKTVLGREVDDDEPENNNSKSEASIKKIANYIIKVGLVDEVLSFIENTFPEDIQDKKGFFKRIADAGKDLFKESISTTHINKIFINISNKKRVLPYSGILR